MPMPAACRASNANGSISVSNGRDPDANADVGQMGDLRSEPVYDNAPSTQIGTAASRREVARVTVSTPSPVVVGRRSVPRALRSKLGGRGDRRRFVVYGLRLALDRVAFWVLKVHTGPLKLRDALRDCGRRAPKGGKPTCHGTTSSFQMATERAFRSVKRSSRTTSSEAAPSSFGSGAWNPPTSSATAARTRSSSSSRWRRGRLWSAESTRFRIPADSLLGLARTRRFGKATRAPSRARESMSRKEPGRWRVLTER
jgi:hypothetical protein